MTLTEKVAYIKGLLEGLKIDEDKPENKVLLAVVDLLDDMALSVADLEDGYDELSEQIDAVDEDLDLLEKDFYDEWDECDDEDFYEVKCPTCGEEICLDGDMLAEGEIECPNCGENLEFDLDACDCGCGCDCSEDESKED